METSTTTPPPLTPPPSMSPANARTWCVLCHASALSGILFHAFGYIFGPLIVWLMKRNESPEIDAHGKEALNFQLSMLIYNVIAAILILLVIGFLFLILLYVVNIIFVVIASIQAADGKLYRYPMTIRFIK